MTDNVWNWGGKSERIDAIDICKAICIISVIAGHICQRYQWASAMQFFYSFHMPCLFIISGYFIDGQKELVSFVKSKIKRLLIPYGVCCGLLIVEKTLLAILRKENSVHTLLKWLYASLYGNGNGRGSIYFDMQGTMHHTVESGMLWFLLALLWGTIIVRLICNLKYGYCIAIVIFFIGVESTHLFWLPFSIQNGMSAVLWIYLGYMLKKKNVLKQLCTIRRTWMVPALIFWMISILFGETHLYEGRYGLGAWDILGALGAFWVIYALSEFISQKTVCMKKSLCWIGQNTMAIYAIHFWETMIYPINRLVEKVIPNRMLLGVISTILILMICVIGTVFMGRIALLNKVFGIQSLEKYRIYNF